MSSFVAVSNPVVKWVSNKARKKMLARVEEVRSSWDEAEREQRKRTGAIRRIQLWKWIQQSQANEN